MTDTQHNETVRLYDVVRIEGLKNETRSVVATRLSFENAREFALGWLRGEQEAGRVVDWTGVVCDEDGFYLRSIRVVPTGFTDDDC